MEAVTPEQLAQLPIWYDRWLAIGSSTEPADKPRAEAAFKIIYEMAGHKFPEVIWMPSPKAAAALLKKHGIEDVTSSCAKGQQDAYWIAYYLFARDVYGFKYEEDKSRRLDAWAEVAQSAGWWWPLDQAIVVCDRPEIISWEPGRKPPRLHNPSGPAIRYRDGFEIYALCGVRVAKEAVMDPKWLTAKRITEEPNAEVRRVYMERFGHGRYLEECGAKMLHEDVYGQLFQAPLTDDEPLTMVRVINSTPEPDGIKKIYWLRVHPELRPWRYDGTFGKAQEMTAHNAVASSFGKYGHEYHPDVET